MLWQIADKQRIGDMLQTVDIQNQSIDIMSKTKCRQGYFRQNSDKQ